jgi:glutamate synthase domain-containing protein 2
MLDRINALYPVRYTALAACVVLALLSLFTWVGFGMGGGMVLLFAALSALGLQDALQAADPLRRNYPLVGRLWRAGQWLSRRWPRAQEADSPTQARLSPQQVRWVRGLTQSGHRSTTPWCHGGRGHLWLATAWPHSRVPSADFRLTIGGPDCRHPHEASVFNLGAMDFGTLSDTAIASLNRGAALGKFTQNTGSGGISVHHRRPGGDLIWQIGPGLAGCADTKGRFDEWRFEAAARDAQVRLIEVLPQHASAHGLGACLPASKVSPEVASLRGTRPGEPWQAPAALEALASPTDLLAFVQRLRDLSDGKPVGLKLRIGQAGAWFALAKAMHLSDITPDFINVEGADAALSPLGRPLPDAVALVHDTLVGLNLRDRVRIGAEGRLVGPFDIAEAMAMGADWCHGARGFMLALGCEQALRCDTNECPTGIATQDPLRAQALVAIDKGERVRRYHQGTLEGLRALVEASGLSHPVEFRRTHLLWRAPSGRVVPMAERYPDTSPGALLSDPPGTHWSPDLLAEWRAASVTGFHPD